MGGGTIPLHTPNVTVLLHLVKSNTLLSPECNSIVVIMEQILRNEKDTEQKLIMGYDYDRANSSESESECDKNTTAVSDNCNASVK